MCRFPEPGEYVLPECLAAGSAGPPHARHRRHQCQVLFPSAVFISVFRIRIDPGFADPDLDVKIPDPSVFCFNKLMVSK